MAAIDKVINIAEAEVGYLEKASASDLYSKVNNAGYNNYTKYGKEMHQRYPQTMDYPAAWCDAFFDWLLVQAFGADMASKLLHGFDDYTVESADKYKRNGEWFLSPKKGDQIFFKNSKGGICHTGLVIAVKNGMVYTIEGNTSSAVGVVDNGGCVAKKSYSLNYTRIAGYGRPNYNLIEEDELMSKEYDELKAKNEKQDEIIDIMGKEIQELKEATTPVIYDYIDENMPDWAKPTIQKMKDKGFLQGDEEGRLGLTMEMLRLFVTNDRAGVYDHRWDGKSE
nr:MAG TPA: hypothetical protein [Caudoviricetes sp.]